MIDTLAANLDQARQRETYRAYGLEPGKYVYVTLHRPANVDDPAKLQNIMDALARVSSDFPVLFPAHPRTRKILDSMGYQPDDASQLKLIEPIGYHDSICLVEIARFVLTDSGGLQEETTYLRIPCLTLRPNTERPVTVTQGSNRLTSVDALKRDIQAVLGWTSSGLRIPELWDGRTAERVVEALLKR